MRRLDSGLRIASLLFCALAAGVASAAPRKVVVDTTAHAGHAVQVAVDLLDGGLPANHVLLGGFGMTGGAYIGDTTFGDVTGSVGSGAVRLGDAAFFNELLVSLTLGTSFTFTFDASRAAPAAGSFADSLALFVLDAATGLPLYATGDSSGALLRFDIDGSPLGLLSVYAPARGPGSVVVSAVPDAPTLWLMAAGLGLLAGRRRVRGTAST